MAKLDLALVVKTVDKATGPLRRIQKSVRDLTRRTGLDRVARGVRSVGRRAVRAAKRVGLIATALGAIVGLPALRAFATLESMEVSFESMLGSAEAAAEMIERLTAFSAKTPFQIAGIGRATKSLLAFGVEGDDIIGKLQLLGDIAAGADVPLTDLAQIYGKAMAKGKAQTEELNQMAERGVPILTALVDLAASYGNEISKEDVYKAAERGQITFKAVEEAMQLMTAEGGIFNEQMVRQSGTMKGLTSTVKDNVFLAFAELGEQIEETFNIKQGMRDFIVWLQKLTEELKKPREEQEGFARALTEALIGLKNFFDAVGASIKGVADAIEALRRSWESFTSSDVLSQQMPVWDKQVYRDRLFGKSGDEAGASDEAPSAVRSGIFGRDVPSLVDAPALSLRGRMNPNARIVVDFSNIPRGTRTDTRADSDVDLEVTTGYSMQGAQ